MNLSSLPRWLVFFLTLGCSQALFSQTTITLNATAASSAVGYVSGNSYTFKFTLTNDFSAIGGQFVADGQANSWRTYDSSENTTNPTGYFWTGITGTGVNGTYNISPGSAWDSFTIPGNEEGAANFFTIDAWSASGDAALGLLAPDTTTAVGGIKLGNTFLTGLPGGAFNYISGAQEPSTYLSNYVGTYSVNTGGYLEVYNTSETALLHFNVNSVSISAVPEPSTYAIFAGLSMLGFVVFRRRRGLNECQ